MEKKNLLLIALISVGIYFYQKKSRDALLLTCVLGIIALIYVDELNINFNEHMEDTKIISPNEALQNIASMYNNNTIRATNLEITGNLTVNGQTVLKNNLSATGTVNLGDITGKSLSVSNTGVFGGNLTIGNNMHINGDGITSDNRKLKVNSNIYSAGNIYIPEKSSLVFSDKVGMALTGNDFLAYRIRDGQSLFQENWVNNNFGSGIGWNAYNDGKIPNPI